jgi:hypothetical protein
MSMNGILIKEVGTDVAVPDGATSYKKDQYCTAPGSVQYMTISFALDGLLGALHQHLDKLGYTMKLHTALRDLQRHLEADTPKGELGEMINNKIACTAKRSNLGEEEEPEKKGDSTCPGAVKAHASGSQVIPEVLNSIWQETPDKVRSSEPAPAGCDQWHAPEQTAQAGELDTANVEASETWWCGEAWETEPYQAVPPAWSSELWCYGQAGETEPYREVPPAWSDSWQ